MKKICLFISSIAVFFVLASCGSKDERDITKCAKGYLDAMGNYKPTEARQYSTQETCDSTLAFFEQVMKSAAPSAYKNNMPAKITLGEMTITDSTAEVAFHKSTPTQEQDGTLHLLKRDGKWQVNEVIKVPPALRALVNGELTNDSVDHPNKFTQEQIDEMRKNKGKAAPVKLDSQDSAKE